MNPAASRVLVVGTTSDYIHLLRQGAPERVIFVTDPAVRRGAKEPAPAKDEEILADLDDPGAVITAVRRHVDEHSFRLEGVACFDCESMELTALLAGAFGLDYPTVESVQRCRDKLKSKKCWRDAGLSAPRGMLVASASSAVEFFDRVSRPCVIKPASGAGSELVFVATDRDEVASIYRNVRAELEKRSTSRLYRGLGFPRPRIFIEEFVEGDEFSVDFSIEGGRVQVVRVARKILDRKGPCGTVRGYVVSSGLPPGLDGQVLCSTLLGAAEALGIHRAICMLDFIVRDGEMLLLELAPRPGGDCLPALLFDALDLDILAATVEFAAGTSVSSSRSLGTATRVGLRLHASAEGRLLSIDTSEARRDPRVRALELIRAPGHLVRLPPVDYDSWLLGHAIFEPFAHLSTELQCEDLCSKIRVDIGV